jgi:hypothetical protein
MALLQWHVGQLRNSTPDHCRHLTRMELGWTTHKKYTTYLRPLALAFEASTEIVHDDARAAAAEEDGILATKATAGTRYHNRLAVIPQLRRCHDVRISLRSRNCAAPRYKSRGSYVEECGVKRQLCAAQYSSPDHNLEETNSTDHRTGNFEECELRDTRIAARRKLFCLSAERTERLMVTTCRGTRLAPNGATWSAAVGKHVILIFTCQPPVSQNARP